VTADPDRPGLNPPGPPVLDEAAFAARAEPHRRELHVHCYRLLASYDEAEDAVQETFLRAWRGRDGFDGSTLWRAWLHRIATNVCLDQLRRRGRRPGGGELSWLQPYPDRELDELAPHADEPDAVAVARETIGLAFLTALQRLPPRQRAAFVLRDVLGWSAAETAAQLDTSVPAANSAVQRARATMAAHLPPRRADWAGTPSPAERRLLDRFVDAYERCDVEAALALAAPDIRVTMPPYPGVYEGLDVLTGLLHRAFDPARDGDWRLLPTWANRMPAAANYLRRPGDTRYRPFKIDLLWIRGDRIAAITAFGPDRFPAYDLPTTLP
jgi:RNA polymerase sigma-70 factor (TIGR02960 family)